MPTTRPKSGMKRPSTPASFMRLSATSGERREVRISRNSRLASGLARSLASMRLSERRDQPRRVGMDRQARPVGDPIEADEVDGIALERVVADHVDAVVLDLEIDGVGDGARPAAQAAEEAVERLGRLGVTLLERGADDRGEIADVLGDEEIVLHEAFDVGLAGARGVAEPFGDRALQIEAQALLGAPGEEMQVAAHRPQELLAARKQRELARARTGRRRRARARSRTR